MYYFYSCSYSCLTVFTHPLDFSGLPPRLQQLGDQGNELVFATCRLIQAILDAQAYFTVEPPKGSLIWLLPSILEVVDYPEVASVLITGEPSARLRGTDNPVA